MEQYKYEYSLVDFKAIERASINLSGLTILSGANGSGKSTLSKWLYYLVNEDHNIENDIISDYIKWILERVNQLGLISVEFNKNYYFLQNTIYNLQRKIKDVSTIHSSTLERAYNIYTNYLIEFSKQLNTYLKKETNKAKRLRILNFLLIDDNKNIDNNIKNFVSKERQTAFSKKEETISKIQERPKDIFFDNISRKYNEVEIPNDIQFKEDRVPLVGKASISKLFNLNKAIYIDSPIAVSANTVEENIIWCDLKELMMQSRSRKKLNKEEHKLLIRIRSIVNGSTILKKNRLTGDSELYFSDSNGKEFKLDEAATGFKSFSYIQRLIENGYLNNKTILLIDEPEAHLHPQWIVEFARILVLVHKHLGTKIMIASHNPDMVAAIKAIAKKEGILGETNFYLSVANENGRYAFENQGTNIEHIFESFNIALDRINQYGIE